MAQAVEEHDIVGDGVSQAERPLAALHPDYVSVDERSTRDLLAFAVKYAADLNFFESRDGEVVVNGDWAPFFNGVDLDRALAYLTDPEGFDAKEAEPYARPHFALFLTALHLLRHARARLNDLTNRHLDYYYRQVLHLTKRGSRPDRVNVLIELSKGGKVLALPANTLLDAGTDSQGTPLIYRTDGDVTVNQAQVAALHTIFADRGVVGLADIWENRDFAPSEAVIRLLELTLGDPDPGDPLPLYPPWPNPISVSEAARQPLVVEDRSLDNLAMLYHLVDFVPGVLYLDFHEYRNLTARKRFYDASLDGGDGWAFVNRVLHKAHQTKVDTTGEPHGFDISNVKDFAANLRGALSLSDEQVEDLFDGIPGVVTLRDAYGRRREDPVRDKINTRLFLAVDDEDPRKDDELTFAAMMERLIPIESNWAEIVRILTLARRTKLAEDETFVPTAPGMPELILADEESFNGVLDKALEFGRANFYPETFVGRTINELDHYDDHLQALEAYFSMSAADYHYLMTVALAAVEAGNTVQNRQTSPAWEKVYVILTEAHREKTYRHHRVMLQAIREAEDGGFDAMLYHALNVAESDARQGDPLDLLAPFNISEANLQFLANARSREPITDVTDPGFVTPAEWDRVYQIVERIQRVVLPEPIPQIETWRNLYWRQDAKSAAARRNGSAETHVLPWQTFGAVTADGAPPEPSFGWAISSPMLALSQGMRTITLTLGFDPTSFEMEDLRRLLSDPANSPFQIQASTADGWLTIGATSIDLGSRDQTEAEAEEGEIGSYWRLIARSVPPEADRSLAGIQFRLALSEDAAPLTALRAETDPFVSPWPTLRLLMQAISRGADVAVPYLSFKNLILRRVHVAVDAANLEPSHVQNDDGVLRPGKPFELFGKRPAAGSRFYLGHPELVGKRLDSLAFQVEWMDVPSDMAGYYDNYLAASNGDPSPVADNEGFTAQIGLVDRRVERLLPRGETYPLFSHPDATSPRPILIEDIADTIAADGGDYRRLLHMNVVDEVTAWERYIQWTLAVPDFQHSVYPARAAQLAVELAADIANGGDSVVAANYQINPPYTPKVKRLSFDYASSLEIVVSGYRTGDETDRLYHIQPFGYRELHPDAGLGGAMFLPQFDHEGELLIGIRDLNGAQTLSLLFQMAEGSADPDLPVERVHWHHLSGNRWQSLQRGQILEDQTRGLINSGIMRFKLGAAEPNTLLDPSLYWLRAAIRRHSDSVCDVIDIHAQAVSASFMDQENAPDHLSQPLPPETITALVTHGPQVAAVYQPYPSFGGKMPEQDEHFYTRTSERLRHKHRALALWDYEHLILEQFPQIYKVKCLPAAQDQPGTVTVIVIPDIRRNALFDPFEPKAAANVIAEIEEYLAARTPAHANVIVRNAHYVPVKVRFAVRFLPDVDEGFAKQQLNDELNRFLSPWAYDTAGDIVIGGRIYANSIVNFIDERPFVDYVAEIRLFKSEEGEFFTPIPRGSTDGYWVEPDHPAGVLVAARQHEIDILTETRYEEEDFVGINYMRIELDFVVGE